MRFDVTITRHGGTYVACVDKIPGVEVRAPSREALLHAVRERIGHCAADIEMISIDVDIPAKRDATWPGFGCFADDPTFDDWQRELRDYRAQRNQAPET